MELLKKNSLNNTHQRNISINNEFNIDTDEVLQITKGNQVSYTLPIHRTIDNGFVENLVLTLQNDNSFSAKIITYNLSQSEKELLQNGIFVDVSNKMQIQNLDYAATIAGNILARTSSDCYEVQTEYEMCCHNVHSTLNVQNGERCTCPNPPTGYTYIITAVTCEEDNGGSWSDPGDISPGDYTAPGDGSYSGGGSGDGSTGTGTGSTTLENPTNNEDEPVDHFGDEDLTLPLIKNPTLPTPCDELKTNSDNTTFKDRMQTLKDNVNGTKEKSFGIYNGNYNTPTYPNPSCGTVLEGDEQNGSPIPYHISLKATAHNHLKNAIYKHIGTFSPNDLIAFSNLIIEAEESLSPVKKNEFAIYLVCDEGNYALKLNDLDKLYNFAVKYGMDVNFKNKIDNFYEEKNIIHGNPKQVQNIGFLKLLKEYDVGIDYYEADENFENWKKLELNSNNNDINETPC